MPARKRSTKWPQISHDPDIQAIYENARQKLVDDGDSIDERRDHGFAMMLAERAPSAIKTDTQWINRITKHDPFDGNDDWRKLARENYRRQTGRDPGDKHYNPFIADSIGDPKAWLEPGEGQGYYKKLAEQKRVPLLDCEGGTIHEVERDAPPPRKRKLAKDIVDAEVANRLQQDPGLLERKGKRKKKQALRELREAVFDHHAPKVRT